MDFNNMTPQKLLSLPTHDVVYPTEYSQELKDVRQILNRIMLLSAVPNRDEFTRQQIINLQEYFVRTIYYCTTLYEENEETHATRPLTEEEFKNGFFQAMHLWTVMQEELEQAPFSVSKLKL